ncbi:hypothetical protein EHE22_18970 [Ochrobactrum pseudogrignonense]|uniref:Deoxycytidine triphosphate deaminase n=1 Tax=Brucella pseudogrignonensis TaxID=419475 RepID=A0A7Y3WYR6_9HYPH|nr:hypothetical protein [Brucella pseudogrignonensis]NNV22498.1 hypothetical protein [Brucella pseudogrignonensis]
MTQNVVAATEWCSLTRENAAELASAHKKKADPLAKKKIPPSLLSAEHIKEYVLATGLISPFYEGGKKKRRLKKASYEGRIGSVAYTYEERVLKKVPFEDNKLKVKANSIVFVECDLDFRLPEYIALRFNLQIRHVHRGLLLGTGPIVDPGFWGKLCIPLHNLTSEDYYIPLEEGLIWVEFTKTTSTVSGDAAIGADASTSEFWDIREFIQKAAKENGNGKLIEIQSSIDKVVSDSRKAAISARNDASIAKKYTTKISWAAGLAILAGFIGLVTLVYTQYSYNVSQLALYNNYISIAEKRLEDSLVMNESLSKKVDDLGIKLDQYAGLEKKIAEMSKVIDSLSSENASIRQDINRISAEKTPQ